jgi:molybdenum cofactor cytidylyltransferase
MPLARPQGAILAHSVRHAGGTFKKGRVLDAADIAVLDWRQSGIERVFAARLEPGDVAEDEARRHGCQGACRPRRQAQEPFTGRANVHAASPAWR